VSKVEADLYAQSGKRREREPTSWLVEIGRVVSLPALCPIRIEKGVILGH
jgi:hypothetical protein